MTDANGGGKPPLLPNTFKTFNVYVDQAMQYLTPEEYVVLSYTTRHILGWRKKIEERRGNISLSMYANGFGDDFGGTGLSRPTIIKALATLEKYKFIERVGNKNNAKGQNWRLSQHPDIEGLREHAEARKAVNKTRTVKARVIRSLNNASKSDNTGKDDNTSDVTQYEYCDSETAPVLVQSDLHKKRKAEKEREKEKDSAASAPTAKKKAETQKAKREPKSKKEPKYTPEQHATADRMIAILKDLLGVAPGKNFTASEISNVYGVVWQLVEAGYDERYVRPIYKYCERSFETFGVNAIATNASKAVAEIVRMYGRDTIAEPFALDDDHEAEGTPPTLAEDERPDESNLIDISDLWNKSGEAISGNRIAALKRK